MRIRLTFSLLIVLLLTNCQKQFAFSADLPFDNSQFINVDGVKIHYRIWHNESHSSNPWILLVHGFSGSTYTWNKNVESFFIAGYNIVAVDVPPFGYSDKSKKINHSIDSRAELLWKFTQKVNSNTQWHLFGHSMGGGIVAAMAILEPQKVDRVVFVAPALFGKIEPGRSSRQKLLSFAPVELTLAGFGKVFLIREKRIEKLVESAYGQKGTPEDIEAYYVPLKQRGMAWAIIRSFTRANPKKTMSIADFSSQALAVWGKDDSWVPFDRMKPRTDAMENLSVVIIKDTGHNPMETDPDLFNRIVLEFLSEL